MQPLEASPQQMDINSENTSTEPYVREQKVRALYMQAPISNVSVIGIAILFFFILYGHLDSTWLGLWVLLMCSTATLRLFIWYRHRLAQPRNNNQYWLNFYSLATFVVGVSWSLVYLFLADMNNFIVVIALFMLFFGVTSSSVAILSVHLPAFIGYTYPQILSLGLILMINREEPLYLLSISLLVFLIMLTLFARNTNRQFQNQLLLTSLNQQLVTQLSEEITQRKEKIIQRTQELENEVIERKKAEHSAQVQFRLLRSVIDSTPDLIFYKNYKQQDGAYIGSNEAFSKFVGQPLDNIIGKNDVQIFGEEIGEFFRKKDREMLQSNETRINEEWVTYPDGRKVLLSTLKTPFYDFDDSILGVLGVSRDITKQKKIEQALREQQQSLQHLAHHDPLTGLPNRLLMTDRLRQSIQKAARNHTHLAILFIDLDHFKMINDSQGHTLGDKLLRAVAKRLKRCVREEDTVARLGGDEFTILVSDLKDSMAAIQLAEKILHNFQKPFKIQKLVLSISTSIGISVFPQDGEDTESLLRNADAAMYRAKSEGRNTVRFYTQDMTERAQARMSMESDIRHAIKNEEFHLVLQPQIDFSTGKIIGAEALIRWQHPKHGNIEPSKFIPIAEDTGQIVDIGFWVLNSACKILKQWEDESRPDLSIAVNISGRQMLNASLTDVVFEAIQTCQCKAKNLEIEITEGFLIQHPDKSRKTLQQLRDKGITVAIDDFGTGYSSLSYLKQYPISKLKIDYSFVRDIPHDVNDQAIASAIIALGKSLDLTVIAEGVENEQQAEFLKAQDCDQAQGFLYSKPLTIDKFIKFWEKHL